MSTDKAYLAAEFDYHMISKDEDRIIYLASLYKRLEKLGEMDYKIYPEGLFDVEDKPNLQSSNAEQEKDKQ
jgi:hypothetical protein